MATVGRGSAAHLFAEAAITHLPDPEVILADLNDEQREAVSAVTGPVAILAGAGTGKTRVISRRIAYAASTSAVDPRRILVVTFTEKAAGEMRNRLAVLGLPQVQASTFHAAARRQLAYHWLRLHGSPLPEVITTKVPLVAPLARQLPGGFKFTPARDLIDEIEWAKNRRIPPQRYVAEALQSNRASPIPTDLLAALYRRYESAKERAGRIDFEDMLSLTVDLYEESEPALELLREKYSWFSVDEYQDTNPLQEALLRLWVGDRRDICVVGDEDQTIYGFTGASSEYLTTFASRFPGTRVINLVTNYRSTPQILALANRLIAAAGRRKELRSIASDGPAPTITAHVDGETETATIVGAIKRHLADGTAHGEIAILVRTNAQLVPLEAALTPAGIPFTLRGQRFYARPEVRAARSALRGQASSGSLSLDVISRWRTELGFDEEMPPSDGGAEARERWGSLSALLEIARLLEAADPMVGTAVYLAELKRRDEAERAASESGTGVTLSTLHRAKGLEWDAVFLPMLEEGTLPISQSLDDPEALEEERRLLYVGITRARRHLAISWAARRTNAKGRQARPKKSRFLIQLEPSAARSNPPIPATPGAIGSEPSRFNIGDRVAHRRHGIGTVTVSGRSIAVNFDSGVHGVVTASALKQAASASAAESQLGDVDKGLIEALRAWRLERARSDGVPAFVVAENRTLEAIAMRRPTNAEELLQVRGIGPARLERYGEAILGLVRGRETN